MLDSLWDSVHCDGFTKAPRPFVKEEKRRIVLCSELADRADVLRKRAAGAQPEAALEASLPGSGPQAGIVSTRSVSAGALGHLSSVPFSGGKLVARFESLRLPKERKDEQGLYDVCA